MPMSTALRAASSQMQRPCRLVVLPPASSDGFGASSQVDDPASALQQLLDAALAGAAGPQRVDVFAAQPPGVQVPPLARLRWHEPCAGLVDALRTIQADAHVDVAWIELGVVAPRGWRHRLQGALTHDHGLACINPLSWDDEWLTPVAAPSSKTAQARAVEPMNLVEVLGDWLTGNAPAAPVEVGTQLACCGVMRAEAAALLAGTTGATEGHDAAPGTEAEWPLALRRYSMMSAVSRHVVVRRIRAVPKTSSGDGLLAAHGLWEQAHPLTGLRAALEPQWPALLGRMQTRHGRPDESVMIPEMPTVTGESGDGRVVRLHVAHSWGGGLSKWVREFVRSDQAAGLGHGLVLRSVGIVGAYGQRLCLYAGEDEVVPLRYWELGVPVHATATAHLEIRRILREIIDEFGVDQVVVSSLIGHSLDVLRTGLPTLVVAHDHYPFCVALYAHFDGECRTCTPERLNRCLHHNPEHRFFRGVQAQDWLHLREAFVHEVTTARLPIVAPSASVARRWQSMMPALSPAQFRVIPHGLDLPATPAFEAPAAGPLKIVVLGRQTSEKGSHLLLQMLQPLLEFSELVLVGCGERTDPALAHPRVRLIAHFENADLPSILAEQQPHVGLLMSTVPETFSYALSELWHAGIPVLATANGALADRIEDGVNGFLEPADTAALLARLRQLHEQRHRLDVVRQRVRNLPRRSLLDMVRDYDDLLPRRAWKREAPVWLAKQAALQADPLMDGAHRPAYLRMLQVNPEVTWLQALRGFWLFTCAKAARSPRLPARVRRWFAARA